MVAERHDDTGNQVRDVLHKLQSPVPNLQTLLALVSSLLDCIGLLPPHYRRYNTSPLDSTTFNSQRHFPPLQRALLEHIIPTWEPDLSREKMMPLVEQLFIPDAFSYTNPATGEVTVHAYKSILSLPFTTYSMNLLSRLTKAYPIDRLYTSVFSRPNKDLPPQQNTLAWEDVVKSILSVPARVANFVEGKGEPPKDLEQGPYFANVCVRCEALLWKLSQERTKGASHLGYNNSSLTTFRKCVIYDLLVHETRKCRCIPYIQTHLSVTTIVLYVNPARHKETPVTRGWPHSLIFFALGCPSRISAILVFGSEHSGFTVRAYISARHTS